MQGFLLHPAIKIGSDKDVTNMKIPHIGTGTGIWLFDMASSLPKATQFHGFYISLLQCPASQWLPFNVFISKLNIYNEISEELVGKHGILYFITILKCSLR